MLTGVKLRKANTRSEKVNNLKAAMTKLRRPNRDKWNKTKTKRLAKLHANAEASKLTA